MHFLRNTERAEHGEALRYHDTALVLRGTRLEGCMRGRQRNDMPTMEAKRLGKRATGAVAVADNV